MIIWPAGPATDKVQGRKSSSEEGGGGGNKKDITGDDWPYGPGSCTGQRLMWHIAVKEEDCRKGKVSQLHSKGEEHEPGNKRAEHEKG